MVRELADLLWLEKVVEGEITQLSADAGPARPTPDGVGELCHRATPLRLGAIQLIIPGLPL